MNGCLLSPSLVQLLQNSLSKDMSVVLDSTKKPLGHNAQLSSSYNQ